MNKRKVWHLNGRYIFSDLVDMILNYFSSLFSHGFSRGFFNKQEKAIFTVLEQAELPCKI